MRPSSSTHKSVNSPASWLTWRPAVIRTIVTGTGRSTVIVCCAVAAIAACSHRSAPATTSPPVAAGIDSLLVSVEDVRRIANFEYLTPHAHADLRKPSQGDVDAPGPCRAVGNSDLTFGNGWSEFRSVGYGGATDDLEPGGVAMIDEVSQAVAVYPNSSTTRGVLHQLLSYVTACTALHDTNYDFALDEPDHSTLRLSSQGWSHLYRAKSAVLISVGVLGLEPADRIANTILQTITDRID
ncbi:hypothetical protein B8W66_01835 [Mycobacterium decipiens]|uniref:PknH-like extracellular domain-containing protein n=1 Tax=Mycobacterium decipiens TaxID=1430326 RepID=A0A1X2M0L1_9MYCO|nr:hypothetical protein B8W66_01835 [Mycobacterium decipiens]